VGNSEDDQSPKTGWLRGGDIEKKFPISFSPKMEVECRRVQVTPVSCSLLNTICIKPFFRGGNLRDNMGNPLVKNQFLVKTRRFGKMAGKLETGFR